MTIKLTIKSRMAYLGVKGKDLAAELGMSQPSFSNLVNGRMKYLSFDVMGKLCKALQCKPNDLFEVQK